MPKRIRNVRTYGYHHYIYIAWWTIEQPGEWLASLAYNKVIDFFQYAGITQCLTAKVSNSHLKKRFRGLLR